MKSLARTTPCGDTIFCDDIRHEITGKVTLVGVYSSHLFVASAFPTKVKLCMRILYQEHPGESDLPLQLQIYLPGDKEGEAQIKADVPSTFRCAMQKPPPLELQTEEDDWEGMDKVLTCMFHLEMNELAVSKPGQSAFA